MARPCKSVEVYSGKMSKEDKEQRRQVESLLKGGGDREVKLLAPGYLSKAQKKIFKYIVDELKESNVLGNLDVYILSTCAIAINRLTDIETQINEDLDLLQNSAFMASKDKYTKDLYRCCNELCLSPQSRAKLANLNVEKKEDPLLALMGDDD